MNYQKQLTDFITNLEKKSDKIQSKQQIYSPTHASSSTNFHNSSTNLHLKKDFVLDGGKKSQKLVPSYDALTDKHLQSYFTNNRLTKYLSDKGILSEQGQVIRNIFQLDFGNMSSQKLNNQILPLIRNNNFNNQGNQHKFLTPDNFSNRQQQPQKTDYSNSPYGIMSTTFYKQFQKQNYDNNLSQNNIGVQQQKQQTQNQPSSTKNQYSVYNQQNGFVTKKNFYRVSHRKVSSNTQQQKQISQKMVSVDSNRDNSKNLIKTQRNHTNTSVKVNSSANNIQKKQLEPISKTTLQSLIAEYKEKITENLNKSQQSIQQLQQQSSQQNKEKPKVQPAKFQFQPFRDSIPSAVSQVKESIYINGTKNQNQQQQKDFEQSSNLGVSQIDHIKSAIMVENEQEQNFSQQLEQQQKEQQQNQTQDEGQQQDVNKTQKTEDQNQQIQQNQESENNQQQKQEEQQNQD